ncbi:MAG: anthranilate synthase component I [Myxococcales bacterium]
MYYPDRQAFHALARQGDLVPVSRELHGDLLTPVAALKALDDGRHAFLLESVEGGERWGRYSFVGSAPREVWTVRDHEVRVSALGAERTMTIDDPLAVLLERVTAHRPAAPPGFPPFYGGAVGTLGYDMVRHMERLPSRAAAGPDVPDAVLMLTDAVVVFDNLRQTVRVVATAPVPEGADVDAAFDTACATVDATVARLLAPREALDAPDVAVGGEEEVRSTFTREGFCAAVEKARGYVGAGDIIQVVLSQRFTVEQRGVDPLDVYRVLRTINPSPYLYFLRLGEDAVAGSSPEVLVRLRGGVMEVRPIAGTRPRGGTVEEDAALETELRADPKEIAEHVMLVDLGRNDVGRVCVPGSVKVDERMVVERYSHVMHLVSHVSGRVREGTGAADVIRAAFPAGTLSGAPKVRAMEIIEELEPERRGVYGGAVGVVGWSGELDLAIAIRTLVATGGELHVQAGAGIVWDSEPGREYEETRSKARAVLRAVAAARRAFGGAA